MGREIFSGRIVSDFEGFDENAIFKLSNGTFWVQARYEYWYHYAYMPEAKIIEENGRTFLSVESAASISSRPAREISSALA